MDEKGQLKVNKYLCGLLHLSHKQEVYLALRQKQASETSYIATIILVIAKESIC